MNLLLALVVLAQAPKPGLPPNHPPVANPGGAAPSADDLMKKLDGTPGLKDKDKPFEIAASLGRLYTGQGRNDEARGFYEQAMQKADPVRALYAQARKSAGSKALPDSASVGCATGPDITMEQLFAKAKAKGGDAVGAASCARAALLITQDVDVQFGNLLFVMHDASAALAVFSRALDTFDDNTDARYARGALLLDSKGDEVSALKSAIADLERVVKESKVAPRTAQAQRLLDRARQALDKGGMSKLPQQVVAAAQPPQPSPGAVQPPQLSPEVVKAFQDAPRTPEMEQNFAKLIDDAEDHLAHGRYNEARASYLQVMPYQPTNPRLRAGMAWTMLKLNRQPMADNVWRAAIETPEAVSALGDTLKAKGDVEGAKGVWSRLRESVPSYAPKLEGKL